MTMTWYGRRKWTQWMRHKTDQWIQLSVLTFNTNCSSATSEQKKQMHLTKCMFLDYTIYITPYNLLPYHTNTLTTILQKCIYNFSLLLSSLLYILALTSPFYLEFSIFTKHLPELLFYDYMSRPVYLEFFSGFLRLYL